MEYLKKIIGERTSLDGGVLITVGIVCVLFAPLVKWAAYAAIVYGAWDTID